MSNAENVCPQVLRGVARELRRLAADPPPGVRLLPQEEDLTDVRATIEGPAGTPYAGGVFVARLALGRGFPAAPPRAWFLTRLFHPNVAPDSGAVCVDTLARDWRPELGLRHALLALSCLLIAPNADSALNAEAAALLRDYPPTARARLLTEIHARPAPEEAGPCAKRERRAADAAPAPGAPAPAPGAPAPAPGAPAPAPGARAPRPASERRRILKRL